MWWSLLVAEALARAPMNGVLVGASIGADASFVEPRLDDPAAVMRPGPDFGFELWGTSGTRRHGFRGGLVYQMGYTTANEEILPTLHLGGGVGLGGFWKAKHGRWGTATGAVGAGGAWVWTREDETYVAVGPWTRAEVASGFPIGKAGALEIGPYVVIQPPIRVGDPLPWHGDYWGQLGIEVTLFAFGKASASEMPERDYTPVLDPATPVDRGFVDHSDPTPSDAPAPGTDPDPDAPPPRGKPGPDRAPGDHPAPKGKPGPDTAPGTAAPAPPGKAAPKPPAQDGNVVHRQPGSPAAAPAPTPPGKKHKKKGKKAH